MKKIKVKNMLGLCKDDVLVKFFVSNRGDGRCYQTDLTSVINIVNNKDLMEMKVMQFAVKQDELVILLEDTDKLPRAIFYKKVYN